MSIASPGPTASARGGRPYLITADDYARMIAAGTMPNARRVELWEGQLVEKMGKNQPHIIAQAKLNVALVQAVPAGWHVLVEGSLRLSPLHVPEPDARQGGKVVEGPVIERRIQEGDLESTRQHGEFFTDHHPAVAVPEAEQAHGRASVASWRWAKGSRSGPPTRLGSRPGCRSVRWTRSAPRRSTATG